MPESFVDVTHDGPIATVTLRRPEKYNAITPQILRDLDEVA